MPARDHSARRTAFPRAGLLPAAVALGLAAAPAMAWHLGTAGGRPHLPRPAHGARIVVGPIGVPRGQELTACTYLKLPSRRDLDVHRVTIAVSGGTHHVHLYRPQDPGFTRADGEETCNFALDFSQWQLILASQNLLLDWTLPAGVAFHFHGREQLAAQTHFVDNGLLKTPTGRGWAVFDLWAMPHRKVRAYAGAIFGQDRDVLVPPHATSTATTRCLFPKPVTLLAVTGHYHYRGVEFTAATWDGRGGTPIYHQQGYLDPAFVRFGGPGAPPAPVVRGLEWTCTYVNHDDVTYRFGPFTAENEHCNLFAFYYPTASPDEDITCVQQDGIVTATVAGH